jgi:hypothetical protein
MVTTRRLYVLGSGLVLLGSLVVLASLVAGGMWASGLSIGGFGGVFAAVLGLKNTFERADFERDHSLAYRVANLAGAVFSIGLGLVVLAVGILSYQWFVVDGLT